MSLVEDADLVRIEQALNELSRALRKARPASRSAASQDAPPSVAPAAPLAPLALTLARGWMEAQRARNSAFGASLFVDPGWNILLHLFIGERSKEFSSISSLCLAADVPTSTGLRWILMLEKNGIVTRSAHPLDRRKTLVSLTSAGNEKMEDVLA